MKPNLECNLCSKPIYRNPSQIKQSKNQLFFCSYECKGGYSNCSNFYSVPPDNGIIQATINAYKLYIPNQKEYLTNIKLMEPIYPDSQTPYVLANAKINGKPNLCG